MKVLTKTDRQYREYLLQKSYQNAWETSLKYSKILIKNIDKTDIYDCVHNVFYEYLQSLRSQNITNTKKNYYLIWETVLNTINNPKNNHSIKRASIKNLYYTSMLKNNM